MIWNWIVFHARQRPRALAVILSGQAVSYGKFAADIMRATDDLRARLPATASLVGVGIGNTYLHWLAVLALSRLRVTSVSIADRRDALAARPDTILVDQPFETDAVAVVQVGDAWVRGPADAGPALMVRDSSEDFPMRMIVSSGTTGSPKRVMLSASLVDRRIYQYGQCFGLGPRERTNCQMGEGTGGGFSMPMATWMAGGTAVLAREPIFNAQVPAAAKPTVVMLSTGNLEALLAKTTEDVEVLPGAQLWVGGSPAARQTMQRARQRLSRRTNVAYGSTEAGLIAFDTVEGDDVLPQAVGYAAPLAVVEIVDDADRPVAPMTQGHVRISSEVLAEGYLDEPDATTANFRNGWFYPGDLGVMTAEGRIVITGRSVDTFNFGGVKVSPIALEETALAVAGVSDAGACKLRDDMGELAGLGVKVGEGFDAAALGAALKENFDRFRIVIAEVADIPRNRMGKIERVLLAETIVAQRAAMAENS